MREKEKRKGESDGHNAIITICVLFLSILSASSAKKNIWKPIHLCIEVNIFQWDFHVDVFTMT